jgi:hypothetical protein
MRKKSTPTYPVGTEMLAYEDLRPVEEKCSHGSTHFVNRYKRLNLVVTEVQREFIKALFYDEDGYGHRYIAYDQFGDRWESVDYWDGTSNWSVIEADKLMRYTTRHPTLPCYIDGELKTVVRYDSKAKEDGFYVYE